jgi:hypothetical protein
MDERYQAMKAIAIECVEDWHAVSFEPTRNSLRHRIWKDALPRVRALGYTEFDLHEAIAASLCERQIDEVNRAMNERPPRFIDDNFQQVERDLCSAGISVWHIVARYRTISRNWVPASMRLNRAYAR